MSLAKRIRDERERAGLTLEELAERAKISKTYLWELEHDVRGQKKPSADVLRHGGMSDVAGADRRRFLLHAWRVVDRFGTYLLGGQEPLPESDFPLLLT